MMKRSIIAAVAVTVLSVGAAKADIVHVETLTYENGYKNAYIATQVNASFGCITLQYGIGCDGQPFEWHPEIVIRSSDPGGSYRWYYTGVGDNGAPWYLKVDVDGDRFIKAWGRKSDGTYYEVRSVG